MCFTRDFNSFGIYYVKKLLTYLYLQNRKDLKSSQTSMVKRQIYQNIANVSLTRTFTAELNNPSNLRLFSHIFPLFDPSISL